MSATVGDVLDKYTLVERVGQGGMAVVYRAVDNSLQREVAVKILHSHLADNKESKDRFEREARAVAKLKHENILEIYDFSGLASQDSYIVTEFIDGLTLREFLGDHDLRFPEVAGMLIFELSRALSHAHSLGILHRDIKPENVMVRLDGSVKLMDFGIAQMVDLQRMTTTGQLLGSPAYMSPEHVEGKHLDFRTDVFSLGIVLYELATGELPFQGKNPHELLKKIAECHYRPADEVNPLVGRELSSIISKALSKNPDLRYQAVDTFMAALEEYLHRHELKDFREELGRFFSAPASYEMAFEKRLSDSLIRRGNQLMGSKQAIALDCFNRVLTLDPDNQAVLDTLKSMGRRRQISKVLLATLGLLAFGGISVVAAKNIGQDQHSEAAADGIQAFGAATLDAAPSIVPPFLPVAPDATLTAAEKQAPWPRKKTADAGPAVAGGDSSPSASETRTKVRPRRPFRPFRPKPPAEPSEFTRTLKLRITPRNSEYRIDDGAWTKMTALQSRIELPAEAVRVEARNPCCQSQSRTVTADQARLSLTLAPRPAQVIARCNLPGASLTVNGRPRALNKPTSVPIRSLSGTVAATVVFSLDANLHPGASKLIDRQTRRLSPGQTLEILCDY